MPKWKKKITHFAATNRNRHYAFGYKTVELEFRKKHWNVLTLALNIHISALSGKPPISQKSINRQLQSYFQAAW